MTVCQFCKGPIERWLYANHCRNCNVEFTIVSDVPCGISYKLDDPFFSDLILHLNTEMIVIRWCDDSDRGSAAIPYLINPPHPKDALALTKRLYALLVFS